MTTELSIIKTETIPVLEGGTGVKGTKKQKNVHSKKVNLTQSELTIIMNEVSDLLHVYNSICSYTYIYRSKSYYRKKKNKLASIQWKLKKLRQEASRNQA